MLMGFPFSWFHISKLWILCAEWLRSCEFVACGSPCLWSFRFVFNAQDHYFFACTRSLFLCCVVWYGHEIIVRCMCKNFFSALFCHIYFQIFSGSFRHCFLKNSKFSDHPCRHRSFNRAAVVLSLYCVIY